MVFEIIVEITIKQKRDVRHTGKMLFKAISIFKRNKAASRVSTGFFLYFLSMFDQ